LKKRWTWLSFLELPRFRKEQAMSTSLLYHAFGIRGYQQVSLDWEPRTICFRVEQAADVLRCSCCSSSHVRKSGIVPRRFRAVPIGGRQVFIELPIQRLLCFDCGKTRQAKIGFADPRVSYTHGFERYALELSRRMTIKDVAEHLNVGWDTIKDIQKRNLHRRFKKIRLRHLEHLAIDEISIGHGHKYLTVVLDLDSGAVVHVGAGKGADSLAVFFKKLRASHARIKAGEFYGDAASCCAT
jgi:transposase